ncbi:6-O-methylguanine DNA methyltransferase [Gongronella butleri]|nr:6-O-methylguanine DNA methyltransferase [Gongronella butleri]
MAATATITRTRRTITKPKTQTKAKQSPYFKEKEKKVFVANDDDIDTVISYPKTPAERAAYVNPKTKRPITAFHYKVYDMVAKIPAGQVTTYKVLSDALGSHPRAVGQALRANPFCPNPVPCHRVIMTNKAIGGFNGGFGNCQFVANKKAKLQKEGLSFNDDNVLKTNADGNSNIFDKF